MRTNLYLVNGIHHCDVMDKGMIATFIMEDEESTLTSLYSTSCERLHQNLTHYEWWQIAKDVLICQIRTAHTFTSDTHAYCTIDDGEKTVTFINDNEILAMSGDAPTEWYTIAEDVFNVWDQC